MKRGKGIKHGPGNPIPPESRTLVETREFGLCLRCGGRGSEWHHRRGKAVIDEHTHCPCNGVLLCGSCHRWAHTGTIEERQGFRLPRWTKWPGGEHVVAFHGPLMLWCSGFAQPITLGDSHPPT